MKVRDIMTARQLDGEFLPRPAVESWLCPHCGREAEIESVEPGIDGELLTLWCCLPCELYAVTPSAVKEPPNGWATKTRQ